MDSGSAKSNQEEADNELLFVARNIHSAACGKPPLVDADTPGKYVGYFKSTFDQFVFTYDYASKQATVLTGDYGWRPVGVVDGKAPELVLSQAESLWVMACWLAATEHKLPDLLDLRSHCSTAPVDRSR